MKLFRLTDTSNSDYVQYRGTRSEVQKFGKDSTEAKFRGALRISEINVPTDKAGVVKLMNGDKASITVIRTWKMTARGGLEQLP